VAHTIPMGIQNLSTKLEAGWSKQKAKVSLPFLLIRKYRSERNGVEDLERKLRGVELGEGAERLEENGNQLELENEDEIQDGKEVEESIEGEEETEEEDDGNDGEEGSVEEEEEEEEEIDDEDDDEIEDEDEDEISSDDEDDEEKEEVNYTHLELKEIRAKLKQGSKFTFLVDFLCFLHFFAGKIEFERMKKESFETKRFAQTISILGGEYSFFEKKLQTYLDTLKGFGIDMVDFFFLFSFLFLFFFFFFLIEINKK